MAQSQELPVVLVGCGGMANVWVTQALQTPGLKLVGLVDLNRAAAQALALRHNLPNESIFTSLTDAVKATGAKAVFDVTIPQAHYSVTTLALSMGCHVLGEKPMADSMVHARKMTAMAKKANRVYAVIQNRRYEPRICGIEAFLRQGQIGRLEEVHADFFIGAHFGGFRDEMDYPLILDMAIHTFDAARFLCGADPVSAYCHSFNPKRSWYKGDASAVVVFEMTKGLVFSYRGSWCAEGANTSWESQWRVIGSKGTLTWDGQQQIKAQAVKPGGKPGFRSETVDLEVPIPPMEHTGHAALIREFVQCVGTRRKPQTHCGDNIKSLAMVLAAVESAKLGRRVLVKY